MSRRTLTIIDTTSEMREIDLDRIGKRELLLGRNAEQCEVVLADPIISKVQGKFLMKKDSVAYEDQDSSNGTFVANMGENRLLSKKDGYVELSDKSVLRIGNIHQPDQMVLLLYRDSEETEKWKRQAFGHSLYRLDETAVIRSYFTVLEFQKYIALFADKMAK